MNGFRFPFLATLSKPFLKYAINNSFFPLIFIICYCILTYDFLAKNENFIKLEMLTRLLGFLSGYFIFISTSMAYFLATNKNFEKLFGKELAKILKSDKNFGEAATVLLNKKETPWYQRKNGQKYWRIETYITSDFRLRNTRPYQHYDESMLTEVFRQNHLNASRFEIVIILSVVILGIFRESEIFIIPAGATIILLFTMLMMIVSAIRSWIQGWTFPLIILLLILYNQLSKYNDVYYENRAYGLDYSELVTYPVKESPYSDILVKKDKAYSYKMLENWSNKNTQGKTKPKAVFIAASGGGSRAALWSFLALQHLDSVSNGRLMQNCIMGTGSSGGMLGMSYFRELKLRQIESGINPYDIKYRMDMGKDILNPVMFTLAVNDVLIRTQKFEYDGERYWKDRAYIFEKTLLKNSRGMFDKKLGDYAEVEQKAIIPNLIFTPSLVNDGRRLLISTLPLSFMTQSNTTTPAENIDFLTYFENNEPLNTKFSSVLRMNASFPYIMPTVSLPTSPGIEVFDSGLRDNYGIKALLNYIFHFREWLEENTSGIVILQVRDGLKGGKQSKHIKRQSAASEILSPFGSLYGNWFEVQDFNNEELLNYTSGWYSGKVDIINYQLNKSADNYISLSWHLTSKEKEQVINSLTLAENKEAEQRLLELLKNQKP
tara:strand:- start:2099 stop:4081 length:1983 start_codon:yes stop_codon:yes gene_type:complete